MRQLVRLVNTIATDTVTFHNQGGESVVVVRESELLQLERQLDDLTNYRLNESEAEKLRDALDALRDEVEKRHMQGLAAMEAMGLKPVANADNNEISAARDRYANAITAVLGLLNNFYGVKSRRQ